MIFSERLKPFGVTALWHMTHMDNLESILEKGIFCQNSVRSKATFKDISDAQVQSRRGRVHNDVPFYFADNTAMLYNVASEDGQVIMLQFDTAVANCKGIRFSDGNVASNATNIFDDPAQLSTLNWDMIQARHRAMYGEWKRQRMAEVLIPNHCAASHIRIVHVQASLRDGVPVVDLVGAIVRKFPRLKINVRVGLTEKGVR